MSGKLLHLLRGAEVLPWEECRCTVGLSRGRIKNSGEVAPVAHSPQADADPAPRGPLEAQATRTGPHTGARESTARPDCASPNVQRLRTGAPRSPQEPAQQLDRHAPGRGHTSAHTATRPARREQGGRRSQDGCSVSQWWAGMGIQARK